MDTRSRRVESVNRERGGELSPLVRRHRPDYHLVLYMGILMLIGLITMYAIGPEQANELNVSLGKTVYPSNYFFIKQLISMILAVGSFTLLAITPFNWLKKHGVKMLWIAFIACILLAVIGLAHTSLVQCTLGACRWFNLGPLGTLQPAEFLKFAILIFAANFLAIRKHQGLINDLHKTLIPIGCIVLLSIIFVIGLQKDMGTGIAIIAIIAAILLIAGVNRRVGTILLIAAIVIGLLMIVIAPHRISRIVTFLGGSGSGASSGNNYQIEQAKTAFGSGGLFGVGIGNSVAATGYLPQSTNDSIFAVLGETFGFIGVTVILLIFSGLLIRLLKIADHLPDDRMKYAVIGVFGWFGSHVILNVAAMIGVFPLTGITLPLLSFGGTSMVFIAGALGLAFQLSRYTIHRIQHKEMISDESISSRRGVRRTRYTSRSSVEGA